MKFLTKDDLFAKTEDGKGYLMDGAVVGFVFNNQSYAAKLTISNQAIYLCQTRLNGSECPDQKGMKFSWGIKPEQVVDYYIFQDDKIVSELVELDKQVAEYYRDAEKLMADFDKKSSYIGADVIKESLKNKQKIAEIALKAAQEAYEYMATPNGIEETWSENYKGSDERYNKTIESWNK